MSVGRNHRHSRRGRMIGLEGHWLWSELGPPNLTPRPRLEAGNDSICRKGFDHATTDDVDGGNAGPVSGRGRSAGRAAVVFAAQAGQRAAWASSRRAGRGGICRSGSRLRLRLVRRQPAGASRAADGKLSGEHRLAVQVETAVAEFARIRGLANPNSGEFGYELKPQRLAAIAHIEHVHRMDDLQRLPFHPRLASDLE